MSHFDEQPDGDPHGECSAEIDRLKALNAELAEALEDCLTFLSHDCMCNDSRPEQAQASAALAKQYKRETQ